jgi:hypothetical protein
MCRSVYRCSEQNSSPHRQRNPVNPTFLLHPAHRFTSDLGRSEAPDVDNAVFTSLRVSADRDELDL